MKNKRRCFQADFIFMIEEQAHLLKDEIIQKYGGEIIKSKFNYKYGFIYRCIFKNIDLSIKCLIECMDNRFYAIFANANHKTKRYKNYE